MPEANLRQNPVPTLAIVGALNPLKARVDALARVMKNLEVVVIRARTAMRSRSRNSSSTASRS